MMLATVRSVFAWQSARRSTPSCRQPAGHLLHEMIVKEIEGRQVMLLSYWDAGYTRCSRKT
jgi:hypothetical protein